MNKYGDTPEPRPACKLYLPPGTRDDTGRLLITDWQGRVHKYRDHAAGLAFAAALYQRKPNGPQARNHGPAARWTKAPQPIVWHSERAQYTSGRAIIRR